MNSLTITLDIPTTNTPLAATLVTRSNLKKNLSWHNLKQNVANASCVRSSVQNHEINEVIVSQFAALEMGNG